MKFLSELFAWWTGNTIGTRLFTWRFGSKVGEDAFGNVYYQTDDGKRRWVVYRDQSEASLVPPEWHGWLHYTVDVPPTEEAYKPRPWQQPYRPNLTGTPQAYPPPPTIPHPQPRRRKGAAARLRAGAAGAYRMSTAEFIPPKPVQRWQADDTLPFKGEFDAVFTNAALHWMRRPKLVIAGVHRALKPRGRFV